MKMLKSILLFLPLALMSCNTQSSATRPDDTELRTVRIGNFSKIDVATGITVNLTTAPCNGKAKVTANKDDFDRLVVKVVKDELKVYLENKSLEFNNTRKTGAVTVQVCAPTLYDIEVSSAGRLNVSGNMVVNGDVDIEASSAGSIVIEALKVSGKCEIESSSAASVSIDNLTTDRLDCEASSASGIRLKSGKANRAKYEASSAGSIKADGIKAATGKAEASTGSSVKCNIVSGAKISKDTGGSVSNK